MAMDTESTADYCFGFSVGASVSVATDSTGEIFRNELGGHTTASLVAFSAEGRQLGEAAVSGLSANAKGTAEHVARLALLPYETLTTGEGERRSRHWQHGHAAGDDGLLKMVDVTVGPGEPATVSAVALLGALLGKMRRTSGALDGAPVAIALPPAVDDAAKATLADAAKVGGFELVVAPSSADALGTALARKWPFTKADEGGASKLVLILDMGATSTVAAAVRLTPPTGGEAPAEASHTVVAAAADAFLGASLFDELLFDHFAAKITEKYSEAVPPASRRGQRLATAIERLRKLLSTLPSASATAENLIDGIDAPLSMTREELGTLCEEPLTRLRALLDGVLAQLPAPSADVTDGAPAEETLCAVETLGGGCRMPCVQQVLTDALGASAAGVALAAEKPGAKLDDASIATGAALLGRAALRAAAAAKEAVKDAAMAADSAEAAADAAVAAAAGTPIHARVKGTLSEEALNVLIEAEHAYAAADAAAAARGAVFNSLEGYILELRSLSNHRKHGGKVDTATLSPLLDTAEDWLYSEEAEGAEVAALEAKLAELKSAVESATASFRAAVAEDKAVEEAALEAASAAAAEERKAAGEDEDHDTRKLKFPDRLRLVQKNKDEGTELFKGAVDNTQYRSAAARYNKALTHASKFVDLSPDQRTEVDAVKLSLHLNIAMCWLKITDTENNLTQAIRACDEALALDEACVKALFRRATAREQKGAYDEAKADLKRCLELAPDDKAVPKLMTRVEAQIARQKAKEKKMYGKMFG